MGATDDARSRSSRILVATAERGRVLHKSGTFDKLIALGLVAYGVLHLLVAWIIVRIAWSGRHGNVTDETALHEMAATLGGEALLWATALGLMAMTLWQIFETIWRRNPSESALMRRFGRFGSLISAGVYFGVGFSAARVALAGRLVREGRAPLDPTPEIALMTTRVLAVGIGIGIVIAAGRQFYQIGRTRFAGELRPGVPAWVLVAGRVGYVGKGITLGIIGVLMIIVGVNGRVGPPGFEALVRLMNLTPADGSLLVIKAVGLVLFGLYCFLWAAYRRR
ncbi:DUF1206 domain-containing protein [Nakamurella flava]|uniref:DUF1206 domain-containing protein n=1 Tax=Nakamurella flava TaxID=2576308 RepID=A0A4U6QA29_9ACTN|nr:DUF1206 domain-containing protein [Nakamurella flava]TKV56773.1 DUF1206 domain-containing protein [Nakamurella flava]